MLKIKTSALEPNTELKEELKSSKSLSVMVKRIEVLKSIVGEEFYEFISKCNDKNCNSSHSDSFVENFIGGLYSRYLSSKTVKDGKENKNSKNDNNSKESKESKNDNSKESKESKNDNNSKENKNSKNDNNSKESKEGKNDNNSKESKESKSDNNSKESKESKNDKYNTNDKNDKNNKNNKNNKSAKNYKNNKSNNVKDDNKNEKSSITELTVELDSISSSQVKLTVLKLIDRLLKGKKKDEIHKDVSKVIIEKLTRVITNTDLLRYFVGSPGKMPEENRTLWEIHNLPVSISTPGTISITSATTSIATSAIIPAATSSAATLTTSAATPAIIASEASTINPTITPTITSIAAPATTSITAPATTSYGKFDDRESKNENGINTYLTQWLLGLHCAANEKLSKENLEFNNIVLKSPALKDSMFKAYQVNLGLPSPLTVNSLSSDLISLDCFRVLQNKNNFSFNDTSFKGILDNSAKIETVKKKMKKLKSKSDLSLSNVVCSNMFESNSSMLSYPYILAVCPKKIYHATDLYQLVLDRGIRVMVSVLCYGEKEMCAYWTPENLAITPMRNGVYLTMESERILFPQSSAIEFSSQSTPTVNISSPPTLSALTANISSPSTISSPPTLSALTANIFSPPTSGDNISSSTLINDISSSPTLSALTANISPPTLSASIAANISSSPTLSASISNASSLSTCPTITERVIKVNFNPSCKNSKCEIDNLEPVRLYHYHYQNWVDCTKVPDEDALILLIERIEELTALMGKEEFLLGCRHSRGRSVTLLLTHFVRQYIRKQIIQMANDKVDKNEIINIDNITLNIPELVYKLRLQRHEALMRPEQLLNVYSMTAKFHSKIKNLQTELVKQLSIHRIPFRIINHILAYCL